LKKVKARENDVLRENFRAKPRWVSLRCVWLFAKHKKSQESNGAIEEKQFVAKGISPKCRGKVIQNPAK
jgi:hypothetical protein